MHENNNIKIVGHSNLYNIIMGAILKASQVLFPLITFPYVSRVLLADGVGRVNFAQSVVNLFSTLAMLGIPVYGIKACARVRDDKVKLATTVKEILIINSFSLVISYAILVVCVVFIDRFKTDMVLFAVMSTTIAFTAFGVEWFYQSIEQYDYITIRSIVTKILSVVVMFVFVKNRDDVIQYGLVLVIGTVGSNILNILRLHKFISFQEVDKMNIRRHMKPILVLFAFSATTTLYNSMNSVILGFLKDDVEVGYFSAATKIKSVLAQIVTVVSSVLMPRSAYLLEQKRNDEFISLVRSSVLFTLVLSLPMMTLCIILAKPLIFLLSGNDFIPAVPSMIAIMPSLLFIGLTNVIGIQLMLPLNRDRDVFISTLVGAIANIIANFALIPMLGALGTAFATAIAEISVFIVQFFMVKKDGYHLFDPTDIGKTILSVFLASVVAIFIYLRVDGFWPSLIIPTIVFCFLYLILLLLFRERILKMVLEGRIE